MVKIIVAGGAGNVAREVIDVLVATKKHDILILSRRDIPQSAPDTGLKYLKSDYSSVEDLTAVFTGADIVLSFISPYLDQEEAFQAQKNIIDACVKAGVKRFAPSEWGASSFEHMVWYSYKGMTRTYLTELNAEKKVLEYCLFQPGLFTNYLTRPYKSMTHVTPIETPFDYEGRRVLIRDGGEDDKITFTTVADFANVVARAVEFEGEWPVVGGITGTTLSIGQIISLGEEIRGGRFAVDIISRKDLQDGTLSSSWVPKVEHPSVPVELVESASKVFLAGLLLAMKENAFETSEEWNTLLPDYKFTGAEAFLKKAWAGKP